MFAGPPRKTSQVDIIVKALPMCYPNGLIVLHGSSAGAFVFHPCLPFRFLPKPQFSTMHGIRIMLYTECDQLGHFEACVPTPQQDLDPSAKVVFVRVFQLWVSSKHDRWRRSSCAQNRTDMSPLRSCSPTSAADSSAGQTGVPYVHTPVSPDSIPAAQPSPVSSETAPKAPSDSVHPTSAADNSVGQRGVPYVRAPVSPDSIEATQPSPVSAASAPKSTFTFRPAYTP